MFIYQEEQAADLGFTIITGEKLLDVSGGGCIHLILSLWIRHQYTFYHGFTTVT